MMDWVKAVMKLNDCILLTASLLMVGNPAYAYLDPGTDSYLFQLLIAGGLGMAFSIKLFWRQIIHRIQFFTPFGKKPPDSHD